MELNDNTHSYDKSLYFLFKIITTTLLLLLTVINNFVLIPRTLAKKHYWLYGLLAALVIFVFAIVYVLVLKLMREAYPYMNVYDVSLLTSPVGSSWSFSNILWEAQSYAMALGIWIAAFIMAWYMNAYTEKEKQATLALQKQTEAELSLLRNQISPHFLFNTLNNIYGLSLKKSDTAPEAILKLSALMRYMLYESDGKLMPFKKEKEVMQAYIDMELLRLTNKEHMSFRIEADKNYDIPTLLWLPVLENVFKHATRVITEHCFIDYSFRIKDGVITIISSNSYKEPALQSDTNGGVGLKNFRKRLDILYGNTYSMDTKRESGVYQIEVVINLN
ncbi:MAG: histidine kinase [Flavipsychrobacter sp.]